MQSIQCVHSEWQFSCKRDHKLRDPEPFCMALCVGPDLRWACEVTSHVPLMTSCRKQRLHFSECTYLWHGLVWWERNSCSNPCTKWRPRARECVSDWSCLFVFIHVAYCSLLEWALVWSTLSHKSFNPMSLAHNSTQPSFSCFSARKLVHWLKRLIIISPDGLCLCCVCQGQWEG